MASKNDNDPRLDCELASQTPLEPFSERNSLVTPTKKLKWTPNYQRYTDVVDSMFE